MMLQATGKKSYYEIGGEGIEATLTKYYMGPYECEIYDSDPGAGGSKAAESQNSVTITRRLYLGGDSYSAPVVYVWNDNSAGTFYNIGRDIQGSITHIATMDGTLVAEYSYDPWGRMRNPSTHELYAAHTEPDLMLGRGYTGHEHLNDFGIINMNARLYDPWLAIFLSPDPYVQAPDLSIGFNRYTYCLNNPLRYTDEGGEFFFTALLTPIGLTPLGIILDGACWGAVLGGASYTLSVALSDGGFKNWNSNSFYNSMLSGAVSGAIFSAMGWLAPDFSVSSTSFGDNVWTYFKKALYAATTGALSAGGGALMSDYLDDNVINNEFTTYLRTMAIAGLSAGLISAGTSLYDYYTWDRLSVEEKIYELQKEYKLKIKVSYDPSTSDYGRFDPNNPYVVYVSDKALVSKSLARSTVLHEYQHHLDFFSFNKSRNPSISANTERMAYTAELKQMNKNQLSLHELKISIEGAQEHNAPWYSFLRFYLPAILRSIF
ncbi:MAG: RHS repeat-associated core domain-containing protein [Bacteroidales bacterium]|nr:RHS repeat-associated core domain-containing protein [Bacteroidales bacterium]